MDAVALLVILAVIAALGWALLGPLRRGAEPIEAEASEKVAELRARRDAKYREIRDAELDLRTQKMSADDHRALERRLRAEAIEILRELDEAEGGAPSPPESPPPSPPKSPPAPPSPPAKR